MATRDSRGFWRGRIGFQKRTVFFRESASLPPNTINVLDDYATFKKLVEGAVDFGNRPRK